MAKPKTRAVVNTPIGQLVPYARNARTHSDDQLALLEALIGEYGWTNPVLADADGIVAGHGRVMAADRIYARGGEIKLPDGTPIPKGTVPVLDCTGWDEVKRRAYILADNESAMKAGWDRETLRAEILDLKALGFDLKMTAFDEQQIKEASVDRTKGNGDADDVPETPVVACSRLGDVWALGDHRLLCGDSTDAKAVRALLAGKTADICWTDPPWNVAYHPSYRQRQIANDDLGDKFPAFCQAFCEVIKASTKPGAALYMAMSAQEWPVIDAAIRAAGFHWSATIIWAKDSLVLGRGDYHSQYEPIWYGWNEAAPRLSPLEDRKQSDLWQIPRPKRSEEHPTMKPVELVVRSLENSSRAADLVFEPFGGSGTTVIAGETCGRTVYAIELEPRYVDVIIRRWEEFTGKQATLDGDGRAFSVVSEDRLQGKDGGQKKARGARKPIAPVAALGPEAHRPAPTSVRDPDRGP